MREQASAGLDQMSPEELRKFGELNDAYRARFGMPFIMAVKGKSKADILAAFQRRLANDADTEIEDCARRNRPDRGASTEGHSALTANARIIRGRILSFTDDPAASGSSAHSVIEDGAVLVAGGLIEAVGEARDIFAARLAARLSTIMPAASSRPASSTPMSTIRRPR